MTNVTSHAWGAFCDHDERVDSGVEGRDRYLASLHPSWVELNGCGVSVSYGVDGLPYALD